MIGKKYSDGSLQRAVGWCETEMITGEIHLGSCDAERHLSAADGQGIIGGVRYHAEAYPGAHFRLACFTRFRLQGRNKQEVVPRHVRPLPYFRQGSEGGFFVAILHPVTIISAFGRVSRRSL